jgi:hypothetical protein
MPCTAVLVALEALDKPWLTPTYVNWVNSVKRPLLLLPLPVWKQTVLPPQINWLHLAVKD